MLFLCQTWQSSIPNFETQVPFYHCPPLSRLIILPSSNINLHILFGRLMHRISRLPLPLSKDTALGIPIILKKRRGLVIPRHFLALSLFLWRYGRIPECLGQALPRGIPIPEVKIGYYDWKRHLFSVVRALVIGIVRCVWYLLPFCDFGSTSLFMFLFIFVLVFDVVFIFARRAFPLWCDSEGADWCGEEKRG